MGHGIAQIAAHAGFQVLAIEATDAALNIGITRYITLNYVINIISASLLEDCSLFIATTRLQFNVSLSVSRSS